MKQKSRSYDVWSLGSFCPFNPLTTWKFKILKKMKKPPGDIIVLWLCTTNVDHMMYSSWDMECFCPFAAPVPSILSFHTSVRKIMIICYTISLLLRYGTWRIYFFYLFFSNEIQLLSKKYIVNYFVKNLNTRQDDIILFSIPRVPNNCT